MADSVAGVVLAAGAGSRLAPLTRERPKALCPVDLVALVDHALARLAPLGEGPAAVAVNVHHGRAAMEAHLARRAVHVSIERRVALGTAGALGQLREWIDGRPVLVTNADAWLPADLSALLEGWDGRRTRLLTVTDPGRGDFGPARYCGAALMPWAAVRGLEPTPSGLYEMRWRDAWTDGSLELVAHAGPFIDCGTPADYLAANLAALHRRLGPGADATAVVDPEATVEPGAVLSRVVLWPGARVVAAERLVGAIRTARCTVLVR